MRDTVLTIPSDVQFFERSMTADDVAKLLKGTRNPVMVEVGAHDGSDSVQFLDAIPCLHLVCVEPDPRAVDRLKAKIYKHYKAHVVQLAYGSKWDYQAKFYQSHGEHGEVRDWDASGSLCVPALHREVHPWCEFREITTFLVRMDDDVSTWINSYTNCIDLIWMDVQGGERGVIEGGRETLKRTRYVYAEFNLHESPLYEGDMNLEETMKCLGDDWWPVAVYGNNLLAKNLRME